MTSIGTKSSAIPKDLAFVVEDSAPNSDALALMLRKLDFDVRQFADGQLAWDHLQTLPLVDQSRLKVIFSDIMMPKMDGVELLRKIRSLKTLGQVPFVFCSAVMDPKVVRETQALNSQGYVVKPLTFSLLQKKIAQLFPTRAPKV